MSSSGALATALALGLWIAAAPALAQSPDQRIVELERKLERSLEVIDELSRRIKAIEQPATRRDVMPEGHGARIEAVEQQVSQMVSASAFRRGDDSGIPIHGFADVGLGVAGGAARKGFTVGSLDLYLTPQLGERTRALIELVAEVGPDGNTAVDLERAQLGYAFGDSATAWIGRFHTPYGYYNAAFHHGQQIATSLRRPRFLEFEDRGGILPAHTAGIWLTGGIRAGGGKLTYDAWAGNSPRIAANVLNPNIAGSTNHNLSTGANLGYLFGGRLEGLRLGAHALRARVDDDQSPLNTTTLNILGMYAVYDTDKWEHIAEIYRFRNGSASGGGLRTSTAGFVQLGYRGNWLTPYARYERAVLDQADGYFSQQLSGASYGRAAFGLRHDLDVKSAIKLELSRTRVTDRNPGAYSEALVQYAIRF